MSTQRTSERSTERTPERSAARTPERIETVVIGGGQAGLSVGYHLARRGVPFVILDAGDRIGDVWRSRWDSLRLFTPAKFSGLDGMPFPAPPDSYPTKDEMADYLEAYAARFELPVRSGRRVTRLGRNTGPGGRYRVEAGPDTLVADHVVVAMGTFQVAHVPDFAAALDPGIVQVHSRDYRNPDQLREGPVLIVGAGNSGAEIAMDLAPHHPIWLSGRDVGAIPFRIDGLLGRRILVRLVIRGLFHRVLTVRTPVGRKARPYILRHGGPLIRTKSPHLAAAGVTRVPRTVGTEGGRPRLEDGRVLEVANVVWCTGFRNGFESWVDLPVHGEVEPVHVSGRVPDHPGLHFVGLHFLHALSSEMIHGVGRDADRIARDVAAAVEAGRARSRADGGRIAALRSA